MTQHVFGLAVHGNYLYWTDWILRGVIRANKYTGQRSLAVTATNQNSFKASALRWLKVTEPTKSSANQPLLSAHIGSQGSQSVISFQKRKISPRKTLGVCQHGGNSSETWESPLQENVRPHVFLRRIFPSTHWFFSPMQWKNKTRENHSLAFDFVGCSQAGG